VSTERPILFSDAMVRAILSGAKTQTRRLVRTTRRVRGEAYAFDQDRGLEPCEIHGTPWLTERKRPEAGATLIASPYGYSGDRLWVREAWATGKSLDAKSPADIADMCLDAGWDTPWAPLWYRADGAFNRAITDPVVDFGGQGRGRPSIHMPRWASRLSLEVTGVRVEQLQDITEDDAFAEGILELDGSMDEVDLGHRAKVMGIPSTEGRVWFAQLWDSINADHAPWASNPWVWVVSFRKAA
jgi:hypothetical protein